MGPKLESWQVGKLPAGPVQTCETLAASRDRLNGQVNPAKASFEYTTILSDPQKRIHGALTPADRDQLSPPGSKSLLPVEINHEFLYNEFNFRSKIIQTKKGGEDPT
jgi:hypothetical protein